jgi:biopolymer transport protein ExbB/TolQ
MTEDVVTEVATTTGTFSTDIFRLIAESGFVVKGVLLILLAFSVLSWAVIIERYRSLRRAEQDSDAFLQDLERERRLTELRDRAVPTRSVSRRIANGYSAVCGGASRRAARPKPTGWIAISASWRPRGA